MKLFKDLQNGLLMNAEQEASGGGSSEVNNQASGDDSSNPAEQKVGESNSDFEKRLVAMEQKNKELLAEKKKLSEELKLIKNQNTEEYKKKLTEEKDFEKLLAIELEAKKELLSKVETYERTQEEERLKVVKTQMYNAFKSELGADVHNWEVAEKLIDWNKFVADEKSQYGFNSDGIKQAVNEFRTKHSYLLKSIETKTPQAAAKGGKVEKSFAERAKESGII